MFICNGESGAVLTKLFTKSSGRWHSLRRSCRKIMWRSVVEAYCSGGGAGDEM